MDQVKGLVFLMSALTLLMSISIFSPGGFIVFYLLLIATLMVTIITINALIEELAKLKKEVEGMQRVSIEEP